METRLSLFCDKVIEAGWLAAAVVVPFYFNVYSSRVFEPDKLTWLRIIALVMSVAWLVRMVELGRTWQDLGREGRRLLKSNPLVIPTLLLVGMTLIATVVSVVPAVSLWGSYQRMQGTVTFLSYIVVFFLAVTHLRTRTQVDRLVTVMLWTSLPIALYGVMQNLRLDPLPWGGDVITRVTANLGNAIFLAAYLIMVVPLTIFRFSASFRDLVQAARQTGPAETPAARLWLQSLVTGSYGILLVIQLAAILFSKSRGPWLGLAAGLALMGFLAAWRYHRRGLAAASILLAVAFVGFVVVLNAKGSPLAGLKERSIYLERLGSVLDLETGTNRVRTLIWVGDDQGSGALGLITSDPVRLFVGHGPETMHFAFSKFYPPELAHFESRTATPDRSHDDILDRIITTGLIGLAFYVVVLVTFYRLALTRLWRSVSVYHQLFLIALLGGITAHLVETIFGIAIAATLTYFWLFLALAAAWPVAVMHGSSDATPRPDQPASSGPVAVPVTVPVTVQDTQDTRAYEARVGAPRKGVGGRTARRAGAAVASPVQAPTGESLGESVRAVLPWAGRPSVWIVAGYALLTTFLFILFSVTGAGGRMEPPVLMMAQFGWLLLGIYLTTHWVSRASVPRLTWRFQSFWPSLGYLFLWLVTLIIAVRVLLSTVIADVFFKQAQGIEAAGEIVQSIPWHLSAIQWQPDQDYYYLFLGRAYSEYARRLGDSPAGVGARPAVSLDTVTDLFNTNLRDLRTRDEAFQAAAIALEEAYRINPLNVDNSANLGRLYRLWGASTADPSLRQERLAKSDAAYQQATTIGPNTAHLWNEWGLTLVQSGDFDGGIAKMRRAQALDPEFDQTYQYLGEAYFQAQRYDEAEEALRRAASLNDNLLGVHSMLGYIYFERGDLQAALQENLRAVEIAPNDVASRRNLAQIYRDLGETQKALEQVDAAIRLAPDQQKPQLQALRQEIEAEAP